MSRSTGTDAVLLRASGICKSYSGVQVLTDAQLTVRRGEIHALMGENGAGKSTLMKVITGAEKLDAGRIDYAGEPLTIRHPSEIQVHGIGVVYQEFNLLPDLTIAENIFIGREPSARVPGFIDHARLRADAAAVLERIGLRLDPDLTVGSLSVAHQQMIEIAKALSYECSLLVLDEPTAALSDTEADALFTVLENLRDRGVAIIYISHRLAELRRIADRVTVMRDGRFIAEHRFADVTVELLINEMVGRDLTHQYPDRSAREKGDVTLSVRDFTTPGLLKGITFDAHRGEILGIAGLVGAGRTELARAIFGADPSASGEVWLEGEEITPRSPAEAIRHGIGYISEDRKREGLLLGLDVQDNILAASYDAFSVAGWIRRPAAARRASHFLTALQIRSRGLAQEVGTLSGGNQQKVVLSKWLATEARVLIFDEPTRGIDVGAKFEVYQLIQQLAADGVTVIVISSDLPEVLGICDRILVICRGSLVADLPREAADQEVVTRYAMGHERVK